MPTREYMSYRLQHDSQLLIADLGKYRTKTNFYSRHSVWESARRIEGDVWWRGLCASQPLQPLACRLLTARPSVGECERDWSVQGAIHTKTRKRLSNEKVERVKCIKQNLKYSSFAISPKQTVGKTRTGKETQAIVGYQKDFFEWALTDSESESDATSDVESES